MIYFKSLLRSGQELFFRFWPYGSFHSRLRYRKKILHLNCLIRPTYENELISSPNGDSLLILKRSALQLLISKPGKFGSVIEIRPSDGCVGCFSLSFCPV